MGWGKEGPTGYWFVWKEGQKGPVQRFEAKSEKEARKMYEEQWGIKPDYAKEEIN